MHFILVMLAAVLLAACAREPRVVAATTDVVTVRYFEGSDRSASQKASDECAKYGKRARLRNVNSEQTGEKTAIYDCVT